MSKSALILESMNGTMRVFEPLLMRVDDSLVLGDLERRGMIREDLPMRVFRRTLPNPPGGLLKVPEKSAKLASDFRAKEHRESIKAFAPGRRSR